MRILNKESLCGHGNRRGREIVAELLDAGLDALDPYHRVRQLVQIRDNRIVLDDRSFEMKGDPHAGPAVYDLDRYDRIFVIGAAKGVTRAALALEEALGERLTAGHVIGKHGDDVLCSRIGVTLAGHPVPDSDCVEGCRRIEALAKDLTERDLVFTIFGSGCGSLLTYPAGDIRLEDVAAFTHLMQIEKGAPTSDLNKVRTHIDRFKGGRIERLFRPATQVHLATADPAKMGTPALRATYLEMLGKNTFFPAIASPTTYADAIAAIRKWGAWEETPESIRRHLLDGGQRNENMGIEEFEATGDRFFGLIFKDATVYPAVRRRAKEMNLPCVMLSEHMEAEAREAGYVNAAMAQCVERMNEPFHAPVVMMTSGENVVTVGNARGVGGRNQEYCVAAAISIAGSGRIVFGAVDTDGTDGPGGFQYPGAPQCLAGGIVDGYTAREAAESGIDLFKCLQNHATSETLWKLGCGVHAVAGVSALDLGIILVME